MVINTNSAICSGDSYTLPWGVVVNTSGIYRDTVKTAFGCDSLIRNITLTVNSKPIVSVNKSNDIDCVIGRTKLIASGGVKYSWSPATSLSNPNIRTPTATPTSTTTYQVQVTANNGCKNSGSIVVNVKTDGSGNGFVMPDAFTPNDDGLNDCFGVKHWGHMSSLDLNIYNRWGQLVFSTKNPNQCWDGIYKGEKQSSGVFVYQVTAETICGKVFRKGTLMLIR